MLLAGTLQLGVVSEGTACAGWERVGALGGIGPALEDGGGRGRVGSGEAGGLGRVGMGVAEGRPAKMGSVVGFNTMPL